MRMTWRKQDRDPFLYYYNEMHEGKSFEEVIMTMTIREVWEVFGTEVFWIFLPYIGTFVGCVIALIAILIGLIGLL